MKKNGLITTGFHIPYNPRLRDRARELRKNMTEAERKLWYGFLKEWCFPVLRQKPLDNYIVDFYCSRLRLVIEIDGAVHDTDEARDYDELRTKVLEGYGLRVVRFTNDEVLNNFKNVCKGLEEIPSAFGISPLVKGRL